MAITTSYFSPSIGITIKNKLPVKAVLTIDILGRYKN
jgi:hypothetical protein